MRAFAGLVKNVVKSGPLLKQTAFFSTSKINYSFSVGTDDTSDPDFQSKTKVELTN